MRHEKDFLSQLFDAQLHTIFGMIVIGAIKKKKRSCWVHFLLLKNKCVKKLQDKQMQSSQVT